MKIWVNGCFDILHAGHVEFLEYAKSLGHHLTVGLDSDERVRKMKGKHRPIIKLEDRKKLISALGCVDEVCSFTTDLELEFEIYRRKIDIMLDDISYKEKGVVGAKNANKVEFYELTYDMSTTKIINRILNEYCVEKIS